MASFRSLVLLAAFTLTTAQDNSVTVWAAAAYVMYGERTPLIGPTTPALTPLGAQQMFAKGAAFRERYLLSGTPESNVSALVPIVGIDPNSVVDDHVVVLSTTDTYVAAGAQAFLQGLYPPQTADFAYDNGGSTAADLVNGSHINFPLGGYQYPLVRTVSLTDPTSSFLEGHTACTNYQASIQTTFRHDTRVLGTYNSTLDFYEMLASTVFDGVFSEDLTNFYNAYSLYDYAAYAVNHDARVANTLSSGSLEILRYLAAVQQLDMNANLSVSGAQTGDMIRAVAGRMLATQVVDMLATSVMNSGSSNKLNLLFGSFEPMLAFFALSGLLSGPYSSAFDKKLPGPGGVLMFELYSHASATSNTSAYPNVDDLYVRFYYQASYDSDTDGPPTQYGLFTNSTTDPTLQYTSFVSAMRAAGIKSGASWCEICDSASIFCPGLEQNYGYSGDGDSSSDSGSSSGSESSSDNSATRKGVAPAVAGVIGALVTLSVVALVVLAAALLGGLRVCVAGSNVKALGGDEAEGSAGGFKGAERNGSDPDVAVTRSGAHHGRHGSWELRAAAMAGAGAATSTTGAATTADADVAQDDCSAKNTPTRRVHSTIEDHPPSDDDIMADMSARPVDPREHF